MTLEHQKLDLIQWIASLQDEVLVSKVTKFREKAMAGDDSAKTSPDTSDSPLDTIAGVTTMAGLKASVFNLEDVVRERRVRKLNPGELNNLIDAVDVTEPIEELLAESTHE